MKDAPLRLVTLSLARRGVPMWTRAAVDKAKELQSIHAVRARAPLTSQSPKFTAMAGGEHAIDVLQAV